MSQVEVLGQLLGRNSLFLIGGPCVLEGREMALNIARFMRATCGRLGLPYVFKSSYDKANRTSWDSFRGPGLKAGLDILAEVRAEIGVPVLTDVHSVAEVGEAAGVVDILQIPAFLARQTDLLLAAGETGKPVNLKKAQFMAPHDMLHAVEKVRRTNNQQILITERGRWFSMPLTACNSRGARERARGGSASLWRRLPARRWPRVLTAFSWKCTKIPSEPSATAPIPCH